MQKKVKRVLLNPLTLGILLFFIIFLIQILFSEFTSTQTIRTLRTIRDIILTPFMQITEHINEIYCTIAKTGLLDFNRCIAPPQTGPGPNIPDYAPEWFTWITAIIAITVQILLYSLIFKLIHPIFQKLTRPR